MKNTPDPDTESRDELLAEYEFDYSRAQPNRFAGEAQPDSRIVVLDPDVARVFSTAEAVNTVLRALIRTMPASAPR